MPERRIKSIGFHRKTGHPSISYEQKNAYGAWGCYTMKIGEDADPSFKKAFDALFDSIDKDDFSPGKVTVRYKKDDPDAVIFGAAAALPIDNYSLDLFVHAQAYIDGTRGQMSLDLDQGGSSDADAEDGFYSGEEEEESDGVVVTSNGRSYSGNGEEVGEEKEVEVSSS